MMERAQNLDELKSKENSTRNPDSLCLLPRSPWTRTTAPSSRKEKFVESSTTWISPARSCSRWWGDRGCSRRRRSRRWCFRIFCITRARGGRDYFTTQHWTLILLSTVQPTSLFLEWMNEFITSSFYLSVFCSTLLSGQIMKQTSDHLFKRCDFIYRGEVTVARENLNNVLLLILVTVFFKRRRWDTCPPPVRWGQTEK